MPRVSPVRFFAELRRRHVIRVGVAYVVVAFGVFQGIDVLVSALELPSWTTTLVVVLGIAAFPVALVLAWAYEIGPAGVRRDLEVAPVESGMATAESRVRDPGRRSLAVLPLVNLSGDPENEYFSDGLAEELLNLLARLPQLRVTSRTSSFSFRGKDLDVRAIADKLGVDVVLEGSVRRAGNRVRIAAQLVDARSDDHLWAETYDREIEDVFAVQEEIAGCISRALRLRLSPDDQKAIQQGPTTGDVEAYDYYLRGRKYFDQIDRGGIEHAREMYRKAVQVDPEYALAWAGLSQCVVWMATWMQDTPALREEAERASLRALELAPDRAEAHTARGSALTLVGRHAEADAHFEEAVRLDPQLYEAWYFFGRAKFERGDLERAAELFGRAGAVRADDYQSVALQAQSLFALERHDEARDVARKAALRAERHLELHPDDTRAMTMGSGAWVYAGEPEKAIEWVERALAEDPNDVAVLHNAACTFASLGEVERALDTLERRIRISTTINRGWIEHDPDFASIRDHPRFKALLDGLE
jgi:adenylate cyclase